MGSANFRRTRTGIVAAGTRDLRIVVETGHDSTGRFAVTVGGNESDSIRRKRVALNDDGLIIQRVNSPYICVIQNLK